MASNTGWMSVGDRLMTLRISAVAVCCSCASARRLSRSRTLAPSFLGALRLTESLASLLACAGFALGRLGPSLPLKVRGPPADRRYQPRAVFWVATLTVPQITHTAPGSPRTLLLASH